MSEHKNPWKTLKPKCKGCIYKGTSIPCEYILITGKSPQSQGAHIDPDGDVGCELYEKGKKKTMARENVFVTYKKKQKLDLPETMVLYKSGAADSLIAKKMGVSKGAVINWRKKNGLPPNYRPGERPKHAIYYIYLRESGELIASGKARECAEKLNFSRTNQVYKLYDRAKNGRSWKYDVIKQEGCKENG